MKVLVIRRGALGDVIHVSACFDQVKAQRPDVEIHVLTDRSCFPLLEGMKSVDKIHEWPRNSDPIGYVATLTAARRIKAEQVDLIVNLMPAVKSRLIAWFCKVPSVTLKKQRNSSRGLALRNSPILHVAEEYYETFQRGIGLMPLTREKLVPLIQGSSDSEEQQSQKKRIGLVLGVGTRRQNKAWPLENFAELANKLLSNSDCDIVLIGSAEEATLAEQMPSDERIHNRIGVSLTETMQELESCTIVIGADTGPMHIATALGVAVVMCFGPTSSIRTGPLGKGVVLVPPSSMECWPCELRNCPLHGNEFRQCMREISVNEALEACRSLLEPAIVHETA